MQNPVPDGWYNDLHPSIYYPDTAIGSSDIKRAMRSLAHMRVPSKDTAALAFGRAFHTAVLEPDRFADRYLVAPDVDRRTNVGKAAWLQFQREAAGREVLSQGDMDEITAMATAARNHPAVRWLSSGPGQSELSGFWTDPATGVRCRMRLDRIRADDIVIDVKTANDASPEGFAKAVYNYGYHIQEAHYRAGCEVLGRPCRAWVFVAQERDEPFAVAAYSLTSEAVQLGLETRNRVLAQIAQAQATDRWPAYSDDVLPLQLPAWAFKGAAVTA